MRLALIRDGVVINVIEAEPDFSPGEGFFALPSSDAGPGWIYEGDKFSPPGEIRAAPDTVSMFQIREAMRRSPTPEGADLLDVVNAFVDTRRAEQPTLALAWEYAVQVEREGVLVQTLAEGLKIDASTLDGLFRLAASIGA